MRQHDRLSAAVGTAGEQFEGAVACGGRAAPPAVCWMLAPSMGLPIARMGGASLVQLQAASKDGIPVLRGASL